MQEKNQEQIFKSIDELVKMSGSKSNEDALRVELEEIKEEISKKQDILSELKNTPEEYYYDESKKLYDQTTAVQIKKSIQVAKAELKRKEAVLNDVLNEEGLLHDSIMAVTATCNSSKAVIPGLKTRLESSNDEAEKTNYQKAINIAENKVSEYENDLVRLNNENSDVQTKLQSITNEVTELRNSISKKEESLTEIQTSLDNGTLYVDSNRKANDDKKIAELNAEIKDLEAKRIEILKDPVLLAGEAKKAVIEEDIMSAAKNVNELCNAVREIPYIDVPKSALKEEITKAEEERDQYYASIQGKSYMSSNTKIEENRIAYLNDKIATFQSEINKINEEISKIATGEKYGTTNEIAKIEENINDIKEKINTFKDKNTTEVKAYVQSLEDEKNRNETKLINYFQDLLVEEEEIKELEAKKGVIENKISNAKEEIISDEKVVNLNKSTKNIGEEEQDKQILNGYVDKVKDLKAVNRFNRTFSEVKAELDSVLNLGNTYEASTTEKAVEENIEVKAEEPVLAPVEEAPIVAEEVSYQPAFADEAPAEVVETPVEVPETIEAKEIVVESETINPVVEEPKAEKVIEVKDNIEVTEKVEPTVNNVDLEETSVINLDEVKEEKIEDNSPILEFPSFEQLADISNDEPKIEELTAAPVEEDHSINVAGLFQEPLKIDSLEPVQVEEEDPKMFETVEFENLKQFFDNYNSEITNTEEQEEGITLSKVAM